MWMHAIMTFRYYTGTFLEALRKAMKILGQGCYATEFLIGNVQNI
jgi:hypothetical protein